MTWEAYELANMHVLRLCKEGRTIPPLDQSFFYRCCNAVCIDTKGERVVVKEDTDLDTTAQKFVEERSKVTYTPVTQKYMRPIMQVISKEMATASANMITSTFFRRFYRWMAHTLDCSTKYAGQICKYVWGDWMHVTSTDTFVTRARSLLPRATPLVAAHIHAFVPSMYVFQQSQSQTFSLLPHKGNFKTSFLTINTNTLRALLQMAGAKDLPDESSFLKSKALWWRRLFNVQQLETRNRTFAYEISTDGRSASVVMSKPKLEQVGECTSMTLPSLTHGVTVRSVDPGSRCLYTSTGIVYEGPGVRSEIASMKQCSGGEFYHKAGYTKTAGRERAWLQSAPSITDIIEDMPERRYGSYYKGRARMTYLWPRVDELMTHYGQGGYKNNRMTRRIGALRQLKKMCLDLTDGRTDKTTTIIGFGDWSATTHHKTNTPGPVKRFRRELSRVATVLDVDESYTSKTCSCCHEQKLCKMKCLGMRWVKKDRKRVKMVCNTTVHGVLHCTNSDCQGKTWDRDVNAARNILEIAMCQLLGWARPKCFAKQ